MLHSTVGKGKGLYSCFEIIWQISQNLIYYWNDRQSEDMLSYEDERTSKLRIRYNYETLYIPYMVIVLPYHITGLLGIN